MQFEDFDKKIKEAADHHHPAYNEDAWAKMEQLLDKHMPEEKDDRRRFIFFILIPLLLAGSVWLLISKPWAGKKTIANTEQSAVSPSTDKPTNAASSATNDDTKEVPGKMNEAPSTDATASDTRSSQTAGVNTNSGTVQKQSLSADRSISGMDNDQQFDAVINSPGTKKKKVKQPVPSAIDKPVDTRVVTDNTVQTNTVVAKQDEIKPITGDKPVVESKSPVDAIINKEIKTESKKEETIASTDKKEPVVETTISQQQKSSSKNKKRSSFFISASAGPDISAAGVDRLGKLKVFAGAGLGYTFKDRLTIRTGFYTGRKVYTASPEQYNPGPTFWQYYPYMEKIDADCKVYEIPLLFTYNFGNSTKHNWFAGAGVSTYLMKEEVYDYYYKSTPTGQTRHRRWTIDNENKHLFSVVTLSGGYQRNVGNKFLLMAEPFVKIPMSGVGFGNVKLNSAGLMMTVGYKPFEKAKANRKTSTPVDPVSN